MRKLLILIFTTSMGFSSTNPIDVYKVEHPDISEARAFIQPEDLAYRTLAQNMGVDDLGIVYENGIMGGSLNFFNAVSSSPLRSATALFSRTPAELFRPLSAMAFQAIAEQAIACCDNPDLSSSFTRANTFLNSVEDISSLTIQFFCYPNRHFQGEFPSDIYAFTFVPFTDESVISVPALALDVLQSKTPHKESIEGTAIRLSTSDDNDDDRITITHGMGEWPQLTLSQTTSVDPIDRFLNRLHRLLTRNHRPAYSLTLSALQQPLVPIVVNPIIENPIREIFQESQPNITQEYLITLRFWAILNQELERVD